MSATTAAGLAELFLYGQLTGDATLMSLISGVYSGVAPQGSTYPLVVYSQASGSDVRAMGGRRSFSMPVYDVKAVAAIGSISALDAIAKRVDVVLQAIQASLAGGQVYGCERLRAIVLASEDAGIQYRQLIQTYRLSLNPA